MRSRHFRSSAKGKALPVRQPASHETPIPPDLHRSFIVAVTVTNLVFWVVLGAVAGFVRERFMGEQGALRGRLA